MALFHWLQNKAYLYVNHTISGRAHDKKFDDDF